MHYMSAKVNQVFHDHVQDNIIMKMWMKTNVYLNGIFKCFDNVYVVDC